MKITAIILAGGLSRRMKRNKLNLLVEGETMLQRVFNTAVKTGFQEIILVRSRGTLPPDITRNGTEAVFKEVMNPHPEEGIAGSIRLGLKVSDPETEGFVFLMADQPFLIAETLTRLKESFREDPHYILQPVYGSTKGGPVFFPADLKEEFLKLTGDTGGRQIMAAHPGRVRREMMPELKDAVDLDDPVTYEAHAGRQRVLVKGAGDLATGILQALYRAGFEVIATEVPSPSCVRTEVAFASAVLEGTKTIEGITAARAETPEEALKILKEDQIPVLIDPELKYLKVLKPEVFVDAVIAKRNTGTTLDTAPLVLALGPGFTAGMDCHAVIETMRGETLGRVITEKGEAAIPDTGTPGLIAGEDRRRVLHAPTSGTLKRVRRIGDLVEEGEVVAMVGDISIRSMLPGTLRGLIYDGFEVSKGLKIGDVDPRKDPALAFAISDKAEILGQAVIRAITTLCRNFCTP